MGSIFIKNGIGIEKKLYLMDGSAPVTYQYNINSSNTYVAKNALTSAIDGGGAMRVMAIGDGTDVGAGSDATGGSNGLRSQSWISQLAPLLATRFLITTPFQNVFGGAGKTVANYAAYNSLLTPNSATLSASDTAPGGQLWNHGTGGAWRFTPSSTFDTCRVYWIDNPPGRDIQINTDLGAPTPSLLVGDGTGALRINDVRCSPGTSFIDLSSSTGTNIGWVGVETYNSSGGKIILQNCGWENSASGDWAGSSGGAARPFLSVPTMAPHLIFINLNITDMFLETPIETWQANIQSIIDANKLQSSIVICTSNPLSTIKYGSEAAQAPYFAAIQNLALSNGLPFIDIKTELGGTWADANSLGYMSDDQYMLAAGYGAKASIIDNFFGVMAAVP